VQGSKHLLYPMAVPLASDLAGVESAGSTPSAHSHPTPRAFMPTASAAAPEFAGQHMLAPQVTAAIVAPDAAAAQPREVSQSGAPAVVPFDSSRDGSLTTQAAMAVAGGSATLDGSPPRADVQPGAVSGASKVCQVPQVDLLDLSATKPNAAAELADADLDAWDDDAGAEVARETAEHAGTLDGPVAAVPSTAAQAPLIEELGNWDDEAGVPADSDGAAAPAATEEPRGVCVDANAAAAITTQHAVVASLALVGQHESMQHGGASVSGIDSPPVLRQIKAGASASAAASSADTSTADSTPRSATNKKSKTGSKKGKKGRK
jgi:hypothetical protein